MTQLSTLRRTRRTAALAAVGLVTAIALGASLAPSTAAASTAAASDARVVNEWNTIAVRTIFTEANTAPPVSQLYFGMVSLAVYDAVVAVEGRYQPYAGWVPDGSGASAEAAAATAAY